MLRQGKRGNESKKKVTVDRNEGRHPKTKNHYKSRRVFINRAIKALGLNPVIVENEKLLMAAAGQVSLYLEEYTYKALSETRTSRITPTAVYNRLELIGLDGLGDIRDTLVEVFKDMKLNEEAAMGV